MNCKMNKEKLAAWVMDFLDEEDAANMASHVKQCPQCEKKAALLRRSLQQLQVKEQAQAPDYLSQRIMARAKETQKQGNRFWQHWRVGLVTSAAVLFLAVGTFHLTGDNNQQISLSKQEVLNAYYEDMETLGLVGSSTSSTSTSTTTSSSTSTATATQESSGYVGIPGDLLSYLN